MKLKRFILVVMQILTEPDIFGYTDYQVYLREYYEFRKSKDTYFSFRFFASKLDVDPGYLLKVTQGKHNLSPKTILKLVQFIGFDSKQTAYLNALLEFNCARTQKSIKEKFAKILELQGTVALTLDANRFAYFQKWYYAAIRALLCIEPFDGDYDELAKKLSPSISSEQAKQAINLLIELDLIVKKSDNLWHVSDRHITTGANWRSLAVNEYQQECIRLGGESIVRHPKSKRDISTMTINVNQSDLEEIRSRTNEYRQSLRQLSQSGQMANCVYQVNIQIFPLSQIEENV